MSAILPGSSSNRQLYHDNSGSGLIRFDKQAGMAVAIINPEDIAISISGLTINVVDLEIKQDVTNNILGSGLTIKDGVTDTLLSVTPVSGGFNGAFVQVDKIIEVSSLLDESIDADAFGSLIDVSSQLGFYNNAIFIESSDIISNVEIHANSDGGSVFAIVDTLAIPSGGAQYYDLKGYETDIKIKPDASGAYVVNLILNR